MLFFLVARYPAGNDASDEQKDANTEQVLRINTEHAADEDQPDIGELEDMLMIMLLRTTAFGNRSREIIRIASTNITIGR